DGLDRQAQTALVVCLDDLDSHLLANLQHIIDVRNAIVCDLGDVQQAIAARQDLNDGAEVQQTQHAAFVDLANFHVCRQIGDTTFGFASTVQVGAGDDDGAVIRDV